MEKDTYVYCTKCVRGESLIDAIANDREIDEKCEACNPWNLEDGMRFKDRKNYEEL